ncbi:cation:proton antiporter [Rhizobium gallicum]|uniref:cation:proton antiporter n=1 Tax=Rhizobium gallicum TaxID=56730 RepID=UPI001EF77EA1|nr:sodium:proton antiporter [Rhizobium gallicum]ULJ75811.1 sodium:proton antiporter [Rhizobium gallicum]
MPLKAQYEFLVFLLLAVLVLEYVGRRLKLPPAASFITGGMLLAFLPGVPKVEIDPDLIMLVFLPPLLMSSAYFTAWRDFKAQLRGIVSLALGAVIFTTVSTGMVLHLLLPGLPLAVCFAIGAIVSPPDAVAATAVLRKLNLPNRLLSLLEGESLINDATGLVLFGIAVAAAVTGLFSASRAFERFLWLSIGGTAVGLVTGWLGMIIIRRLGETELVITATLLLSTASYICAEAIGGSGVLSTVATGLVVSWHQHDAVYASTRVRAHSFWKSLVFILESFLFILIGLSLREVLHRINSGDAQALYANAVPVAAVIVTVVLARFVWLGMCALTIWPWRHLGRTSGRDMAANLTIIGWSGMRGVVTLAAALSFPSDLPGRDLVLLSSFAVIVVTVLIQGSTLAPLARILGVAASAEHLAREENKTAVRKRLAAFRHQSLQRNLEEKGFDHEGDILDQRSLQTYQANQMRSHRPVMSISK